jgi:hypothetical protein
MQNWIDRSTPSFIINTIRFILDDDNSEEDCDLHGDERLRQQAI